LSDFILTRLVYLAGKIDAVYLDRHGAMVAEHLEDGEGALLQSVRRVIGPDILLVASLDLHANVTHAMVDAADLLTAYRTYPHVDMAEAGRRTARALNRMVRESLRPAKAFHKADFLIPLTGSCTLVEPAASLYAEIEALDETSRDGGYILGASFATGFSPADIQECGPSILAYAETPELARTLVEELRSKVEASEAHFSAKVWTPEAAISHAQDARRSGQPVVMADTQDNPGAGGNGDTVGILKALLSRNIAKAAIGVLYDATSAASAHEAGEGAQVHLDLGSHTGGAPEETPASNLYTVLSLSDGEVDATGPYYDGGRLSLGPTALLEIGGVKIVVGSKKVQCADQAMFTHLGVEPSEQDILVVKSSVHFRADFGPIAKEVLVVASPGPNPADHRDLTYKNLRKGVRLMPGAEEIS